MKYFNLGQTGVHVSALGLGTVKFGRNQQVKYPHAFEIPDDHTVCQLLSLAKDHGINLLDTSPAYGQSEERLGKLLSFYDRHQWVICTKVGEEFVDGESYFDFTPNHLQRSIERSLKRLNTDYLDIVLIHSDGNDCELIEKFDVFSTLAVCKQQGLIRSYGMSSKTIAGGLASVHHADLAMITYHPKHIEERPILDAAEKFNKGILIKKALASGHLTSLAKENPIVTSMQFIFNHPGVNSIIVGTINPQHLQANIQCIESITYSR